MSCEHLLEWHKRFTSGREDVEDDPKSGRSSTTKSADNIGKRQSEWACAKRPQTDRAP